MNEAKPQTTVMVLFVLVTLIARTFSSILAPVPSPKKDRSYDRYVLALTWGGSICKMNECNHTGCATVFNLHGLWPSNETEPPENCTKLMFKQSNLKPGLKNALAKYWSSFYSNDWKFLHHEFEKHGTCWEPESGDVDSMVSAIRRLVQEYNSDDKYSQINTYIEVAIGMSKLLNPYKILSDNDITPDTDKIYHIQEIIGAFNDHFKGEDFMLPLCERIKQESITVLSGTFICVDLNYQPIPCAYDIKERSIHSCRDAWISYPVFAQPSIR